MVHILGFDAVFLQVFGQVLGHFDRQRRDKRALAALDAGADLAQQVLDLALDRAHDDQRVQQAGGADDLLGHTGGVFALIRARRGRDKDLLVDLVLKLLKPQRAVVERRRQAETIFYQRLFAAVVAAVHAAHLRQHDVAFVHHQQEIVGEIIQQRRGGGTRRAAGQHGAVVLDAFAGADFLQHLHIIVGALLDALRLEQFALLGEGFDLLFHLLGDLGKAGFHLFRPDDVVAGREDRHMAHDVLVLAGQGVELDDAVDLVAEKLYPDGILVVVRQMDVDNITLDAELVADKVHVVALIL